MKNLLIPGLIVVGGAFAFGGKKKKKKKKKADSTQPQGDSIKPDDDDKVVSEGKYPAKHASMNYRIVGNGGGGYYGEGSVDGQPFKVITGASRFPTVADALAETKRVLGKVDESIGVISQKEKCAEFFASIYEPNPGPGEIAVKDVAVTQDILPAMKNAAQSIRTATGSALTQQDADAILLEALNTVAPECKIAITNNGYVYTDAKSPMTDVMTKVWAALGPVAYDVINEINAKNPILQSNDPNSGVTSNDPSVGNTSVPGAGKTSVPGGN